MKSFFNPDNWLMIFLGNITDIMLLNAVCLLCCLPIITIGPSVTALHYVTLKMSKGEEGYIIKDFFKSFKENFRQSTIIWLIFLLVSAFFYLDLRIIEDGGMEVPYAVSVVIYVTYLFCCTTAMYAFPLTARFTNKISQTLRNAFLMSILHVVKTVIMAAIYLIPIVLIPLNYNFIAIFIMIGLSGPAYINGYFWKGIFKKYEPEEEIPRDWEETEEVI